MYPKIVLHCPHYLSPPIDLESCFKTTIYSFFHNEGSMGEGRPRYVELIGAVLRLS